MAVSPTAWLHEEVKTQLELGDSWLADKNKANAALDGPSITADSRWKGIYHDNGSCIEIFGPISAQLLHLLVLKLLHRSEDIATALQQLHRTRVLEDRRCLRAKPKEEEDLDDEPYTMAGAHESRDEDVSMNTQMPFNTQVQHQIRPRKDEGDLQFVGTKRLEPVLAGNTKRADLKPRSGGSNTGKSVVDKQAQLLSLLKPAQPPVVPHVQTRVHADPRPQLTETPNKRAARERNAELVDHSRQSPTQAHTLLDKGKKRMRETDLEPPSTDHSTKKTSLSGIEAKQSTVNEIERFAAECSWIKGFKFNHEACIVPEDQASILRKPESWHKPEPGLRFPEANIPMRIFETLSKLQDEKIASEEKLEDNSGSHNETDPPPTSCPPSALRPEDEQEDESEDEPYPWTPSPGPEPPQQPTLSRQSLPPDSSSEVPADDTASAMPHRSAATEVRSPQPSLPPSSEEGEVAAPPSSPPSPQEAVDSDDEMELETSVPQALGEDLDEHTTSRLTNTYLSRAEPSLRPVIQVKETPYVKGKNGQPVVTISPPTQSSNAQQLPSSSAPIVRGTYHEFNSSVVEETNLDALRRDKSQSQQANTNRKSTAQTDELHTLLPEPGAQDVSILDMCVNDEPLPVSTWRQDGQKKTYGKQTETLQESAPAQPEPTPMSAQLPPKDSSSGQQPLPITSQIAPVMPMNSEKESSRQPSRQLSATPSLTKRKLETTPTKDSKRNPRPPKRFKFVGFGSNTADVLRRLESERRKSSTSIESRQGSVISLPTPQDADTKMELPDGKGTTKPQIDAANVVVDGDMSPRHQSLYAAPSPTLRPSPGFQGTTAVVEGTDDVQAGAHVPGNSTARHSPPVSPSRSQQIHMESQQEMQPRPQLEPQAEQGNVLVRLPEPHPQPDAIQPSSEVGARAEQAPPTASISAATPSTVFETFKLAYPEYGGAVGHFKNWCLQVEKLDRDDKMVPKWMWDDYIIRNRTDYKDYTDACNESGEDPVPYIRFYKDTIRDTVYKKGIIETRATLLRALQELGLPPRTVETPAPSSPSRQSPQLPKHQSPRPPVPPPALVRPSQQQLAQHFHQQPIQQSSGQSVHHLGQSPIPPAQTAITPPKKKLSRKSLPFKPPIDPTPAHINATSRIRHSLPASSSRFTPDSTSTPSGSARQASGVRPKPKSRLAGVLQSYLKSDDPPILARDEFREFSKSQAALTSVTGSTRVSSDLAPTGDIHRRVGDKNKS
ncbi:hypothetical protein N0V95_000128 [Ascochyta clinopodiicola]|nr:hypothetical protein N0V95_000128 [Ascochyta clinopodiicola]